MGPGSPSNDIHSQLASLRLENAFRAPPVNLEMARCCLSGLWLAYDFLDESHSISQGVPTSSGSYWHGIMHRREGDFSNAKYWFRRVGEHPIFSDLGADVAELAQEFPQDPAAQKAAAWAASGWDAAGFVDACQRAVSSGEDQFCRQAADLEWKRLFDYCYLEALGT